MSDQTWKCPECGSTQAWNNICKCQNKSSELNGARCYRKLEAAEFIPRYNIPDDLWIFPDSGEGRVFTGPGGHPAGDYGYPIFQKVSR